MRFFWVVILGVVARGAVAQKLSLSLDDAIRLASEYSLDAQLAKFSYTGAYWTYRSFRAELLPSINLGGTKISQCHSKKAIIHKINENTTIRYHKINKITLTI